MDQEEIIVDLDETSELDEMTDLEATELEEPEYPMYVVVGDMPADVFSPYIVLILSVLIMYPIYRAMRTVAGSVKAWRS